MSISDFLQKYKIIMYPNFWPIFFFFFFYIAPIFHLSPCPWGTLCTSLGLGTVHIWTGTGTWNSVPVPNGTFFRYFTLCNDKNIYFSEKISPKLAISTFWTIGPTIYLFFSDNQMKAWNIFFFLSNENETLLFFGKQTEVYC